MTTQKIKIKGMHCASCEILIEDTIKSISGVSKINVSHKNGIATIIANREISLQELQDAMKGTTYSIETCADTAQTESKKSYGEIGAIALIIMSAYLLISKFNLIPSINISSSVGASTAFVTGLVAAFSSCIAVTGSLLLATSTRYFALHPEKTLRQRITLNTTFNAGRLVSYIIFGALLGLLGSKIAPSPKTMGFIIIVSSIIMIILGLKMLKIFPFLERISFTLPKWISRYFTPNIKNTGYYGSFMLGASTFFLPCGFTQAMQLYVISRGNPFEGALILGMFALGTLPALISVGAMSNIKNIKFQHHLARFAGVLVILVGFTTVQNGFALTGTPSISGMFSNNTTKNNVAQRNVTIKNGTQILEMSVNGLNYYPEDFTVQNGIPVELRVDGRGARGCGRVIAIPDLNIMERLNSDSDTVLKFIPTRNGRITVSCSMGMAGPAYINVITTEAPIAPEAPIQKQPCDPEIAQCLKS